MAKDYTALTRDISTYVGELRRAQPEPMQAFSALAKTASADGAVDKKTKELIALGATRDEIAEVMAMCVYMGGGPALMYAADALRAFDQFAEAA